MSQHAKSLSDWLAFFEQADIPVLRHSARELERLHDDESQFNARSIAHVVTDDPLMTLKLLRYLQTHKHPQQQHELVDVKQALLMMGLEAFFREIPAAPIAEDLLHDCREALVYLLQTVHRARRSAYYAFDWALRLHDRHAEEVQVSALLSHVAEMLMWCFNPDVMLILRRMQAADPTLRSADAQRQVLGFSGVELQRELTRQWDLPGLLLNLTDPAHAHSNRVRNVVLAVNLARHSAHGWEDAALPDDYRDIGELLHMDATKVMAMVMAAPMIE